MTAESYGTAPEYPLVVVLGPTGSGKSDLALFLAEEFDGEIINADSIQVYRGLDIGSAKIGLAERVRIPHHLLDVIDLAEELTSGAYARLGRDAIRSIRARQKLPIVVGGTGLYIRALVDGLSPAPARNVQIRERLSQIAKRRPAALHRFLRRADPDSAAAIHQNDIQKLIRAVELTLIARQPASAIKAHTRQALAGAAVLKLGLAPDRSSLYKRLDERCAWMFANGLISETRALLESGVAPDSKPLSSLGYRQAVKHLTGSLTADEAVRECQTRTRQYAKRQLTWFRAEANVQWLQGFGAENPVQKQAMELTKALLAGKRAPAAPAGSFLRDIAGHDAHPGGDHPGPSAT
jgi:tRNA dimethylallyltransferase